MYLNALTQFSVESSNYNWNQYCAREKHYQENLQWTGAWI